MVRSHASEFGLHDLGRVLLRQRRKATLFCLASVAVSAGVIAFGPRSYRSEAKLFVRLGRENLAIDPTATLGQPASVSLPVNRESELNSVAAIIKSRSLIEKVVDALGPSAILDAGDSRLTLPLADRAASPLADGAASPLADGAASPPRVVQANAASWAGDSSLPGRVPEREKAILSLLDDIRVEAIKKSDVIQVTCESPSPGLAQAVVAKLVEFYLDQHIETNRTPGAREFFAQQTERLHDELDRREQALLDLKNETGMIAPEEQRRVLVAQIGRLEDELLTAQAAEAAARAEVDVIGGKLAGFPEQQVTARTVGFANEAADDMRAQLYALELKEQELLAKYTDAHPELRQLREQLTRSRAVLASGDRSMAQLTTAPSRTNEQAQLSLLEREPALAACQAKVRLLAEQLEAVRGKLTTLNDSDSRVGKLAREVALQDASYRKYFENLEQATIDEALQLERMSNIRVVQPASYELKPVRPRRLLVLALGMLVGSLGGVGLALMADARDDPLKTPDDLARGLVDTAPHRRRRQMSAWLHIF
jgi:polysaccharide biosynthesis protein PslE